MKAGVEAIQIQPFGAAVYTAAPDLFHQADFLLFFFLAGRDHRQYRCNHAYKSHQCHSTKSNQICKVSGLGVVLIGIGNDKVVTLTANRLGVALGNLGFIHFPGKLVGQAFPGVGPGIFLGQRYRFINVIVPIQRDFNGLRQILSGSSETASFLADGFRMASHLHMPISERWFG